MLATVGTSRCGPPFLRASRACCSCGFTGSSSAGQATTSRRAGSRENRSTTQASFSAAGSVSR